MQAEPRGCASAQKDHQCGIVIAKGLPPHQGNATWEIDENVPQATYFVRAYSVCGSTVCAFGNSTGFFQVGAPPRDVRLHSNLAQQANKV